MKPSPYADIINLPHHVSKRHPQMPMRDRAAQFAPFAALNGYDDSVDETARVSAKTNTDRIEPYHDDDGLWPQVPGPKG